MIGDLDIVVPDVVEAIRAVRCWKVTDDLQLRSINDTAWPVGATLDAVCLRTHQQAMQRIAAAAGIGPLESTSFDESTCDGPPSTARHELHNGSGCGIYAFKTTDRATVEYPLPASDGVPNVADGRGPVRLVFGEVWLSGRVMEHEHGYRASRARVAGFYADTHPQVDELAALHGVPVLPCDVDRLRDEAHRSQEERWQTAIASYTVVLGGSRPSIGSVLNALRAEAIEARARRRNRRAVVIAAVGVTWSVTFGGAAALSGQWALAAACAACAAIYALLGLSCFRRLTRG